MIRGSLQRRGGRCLDGTSQDLCHLQVSFKDRGPKRELRVLRGSVFIGQDADNVFCGLEEVGGVGDFGEVKLLWEELECVCVPSGCSGGNVAVVTVVMFERGTNIPTVNSVC